MWNSKLRSRELCFSKQKNIDIDQTRAFGLCAFADAPETALDLLRKRQKLARKQRGFGRKHDIKEPGLIGEVARFCFVNIRASLNAHSFSFEVGDRFR